MLAEQISQSGGKMRPQDFETSIAKLLHTKQSAATRVSSKAAAALAEVAVSGALVIYAAAFYRLSELLAALLVFSVAIGPLIIAVLILWLAGEAIYEAASRIEKRGTHNPAWHFLAWSRARAAHIHRSRSWN
jgi:hypothetical protein